MTTIKLAPHITMAQISLWLKLGIIFETHGLNGYAMSDDPKVVTLINEANQNVKN